MPDIVDDILAGCPTSKPLSGDVRKKLVARLNGVLGGCLATESFTPAQIFYFGGVGEPSARSQVIVVGTCCGDQLNSLLKADVR